MTQAMPLKFLTVVPRYFFWVAFTAWLATFAGLLHALANSIRSYVSQRTGLRRSGT